MPEVINEIIKRYGALGLVCLVLVGGAVWYMAHTNAKAGETISVLWSMVEYTKPIQVPPKQPDKPQQNVVQVSAVQYDRTLSSGVGAGVLPYGEDVITNLDATPRTNSAVYKIPNIVPGKYSLLVEYASAQSRPVEIYLNNNPVNPNGLAQTTGGWGPSNQQWKFQGYVTINQADGNVLKLHRDNVFPHIRAIKFVPI